MTNDDPAKLMCPFLDRNKRYSLGFECGIAYMRMLVETRITDTFMIGNQEQLTLLANRLGWHILEMSITEDGKRFAIDMERR